MNFAIQKGPRAAPPGRKIEAKGRMFWHAENGSYSIDVIGYGSNEIAALKNAQLLAGQARAALTIAVCLGESQ